MSTWGAGVKSASKGITKKSSTSVINNVAAAVGAKPKGLVTMVQDINARSMTLGPVEDGRSGDKFRKIDLDLSRFTLGFCTVNAHTHIPFKAGPYTAPGAGDKDPARNAWQMLINITPEQFDAYSLFEENLKKANMDKRDELYPQVLAKSGAKKVGMSKEMFEDKFNSVLKPADVEAGYPATMRVTVPHETEGFGGRVNVLPKIQTTNLNDNNTCSKRKLGSINDLNAKSAVVPTVNVVRGLYAGNQGWGIKLTLVNSLIILNKSGVASQEIDMSGVTELSDDDEEDGAKTLAIGEENDQFVNDSNTPAGF